METYITPTLIKLKIAFKSLSQDIEEIPLDMLNKIKKNIVDIIEIILTTITDKEKVSISIFQLYVLLLLYCLFSFLHFKFS